MSAAAIQLEEDLAAPAERAGERLLAPLHLQVEAFTAALQAILAEHRRAGVTVETAAAPPAIRT